MLTHPIAMTQDKQKDPKTRKNVYLRESIITTGEELLGPLRKNSFSHLLTDLIMEARDRHMAGGEKSQEQYLTQIVDLLEKNKAFEAKLKEKDERFKLERKGLVGALRLAEEDLKKARSQGE